MGCFFIILSCNLLTSSYALYTILSMNKACMTGLKEVWGGRAPGSAGSINASRAAGKHGTACRSYNHDMRYVTAINSGGLGAAPQPSR